MSIADLLNPTDPLFDWSHHIEHANLFWKVGPTHTPATVFSEFTDSDPAKLWQLQHQESHDWAADVWGVQPSPRMIDEPIGSPMWSFQNFTHHLALNGAALVSD